MTAYRSSLARIVAPDPMTDAELDERAREAWRQRSDMVSLRLSAIRNEWTRQEIINELTRQHGARPKKRG